MSQVEHDGDSAVQASDEHSANTQVSQAGSCGCATQAHPQDCCDNTEQVVEKQQDCCQSDCACGCVPQAQSDRDETSDAQTSNNDDGQQALGDASECDESALSPLEQAQRQAAEYLEALQRERAEFVNYRNRTLKEQERFRQHGLIDVLTALLPALDDIDRIRQHSELDDSFAAVASKIDKVFEKFGVQKFGSQGEVFDPTEHDAILHKPDEHVTEQMVDTVVEAGYRIGDRVIRAARVVVASPQQ